MVLGELGEKLGDLSPCTTPMFYCKSQYPLASVAALCFSLGTARIYVTRYYKQLDAQYFSPSPPYSPHAGGIQSLPACCMFGGGGKQCEVSIECFSQQVGAEELVWAFFLNTMAVCVMSVYSEETAFHKGETSLGLIADPAVYLIASQMVGPCLNNNNLKQQNKKNTFIQIS